MTETSKPGQLDFKKIFEEFIDNKKKLKVISVASCNSNCRPNSAAKMLIDIALPDRVFFLDYKFTQTYSNVSLNPVVSISFMDDDSFTGYRLTGKCKILTSGKEFDNAQKSWEKRLITYEADRIIQRVTGHYSTREAENVLPKDFVVMKLLAEEASTIKPNRVFRGVRQKE